MSCRRQNIAPYIVIALLLIAAVDNDSGEKERQGEGEWPNPIESPTDENFGGLTAVCLIFPRARFGRVK